MNPCVVTTAQTWLGTPYRHQGAIKGAGCDCLGLIRGVWRELYGAEPEAPPPYRPDWAEVCAAEPMLAAARRHLIERRVRDAEPGDILLFRMTPHAAIKHAAILTAAPTPHDPHPRMIHAYWGRAVVESWLGAVVAPAAGGGVRVSATPVTSSSSALCRGPIRAAVSKRFWARPANIPHRQDYGSSGQARG